MKSLRKKANILFFKLLGLGFVFLGVLVFLAVQLFSKLELVGGALLKGVENACGCQYPVTFGDHPFVFSLLGLSGIGLLIFLSYSLLKIITLRIYTSNFVKKSLNSKSGSLSPKLYTVVKRLGLDNKVVEIKGKSSHIFCYGSLKPKICISNFLVEVLSSQELEAVLIHEAQHLQNYEPAKIFLSKSLATSLFFIPGISLLNRKYLLLLELAADEKATIRFESKKPLAGAMEKIISLKNETCRQQGVALPFFSIIDERISKLADKEYKPNLKVFSLKTLLLLPIVLILFLSVYLPLNMSGQAVVQHQSQTCTAYNTYPQAEGECYMSDNEMLKDKMLKDDEFCYMNYQPEFKS